MLGYQNELDNQVERVQEVAMDNQTARDLYKLAVQCNYLGTTIDTVLSMKKIPKEQK